MKKLALAVAVLFVAMSSQASPYFRPIDPAHPQLSAGAVFSTKALNQSAGVTDLALITHSTADGTIIPKSLQSIIAPESWVPLQIGGGGSFSGSAILNIGSSYNIAPQVAALALKGVSQSSSPLLVGLKNVLNSNYAAQGLSFAMGPTWYTTAVENGTMLPIDKWRGALGLFAGAAWKF